MAEPRQTETTAEGQAEEEKEDGGQKTPAENHGRSADGVPQCARRTPDAGERGAEAGTALRLARKFLQPPRRSG